jgi:hypothetical protein
MEPALRTLKAALETIRDIAMNALAQIAQSQEEYSGPFRWKALADAPRCKSTEFTPIFCK